MMRGDRVVRDEHTLTVYANRVTISLGFFISIAFIVSGALGIAHGSTEAMDIFGIALGIVFFVTALWMGASPKPLLVVNARGICSPLFNQAEVLEWHRIAAVRVGAGYMQNSFTVDLRRDVDHPETGTKLGLHIPSGALPMRTKNLVTEALTYRPTDHREPRRPGPWA